MNRRQVLLSAAALAGGAGGSALAAPAKRMPVLFLAHGAPPLLEDATWMKELATWAAALPRPKAVLVLSAHWETRPIAIGATAPKPLIYDFYGFPEHFYRLQYPSPGAPQLAERVKGLLSPHQKVESHPERGLDHGVYIPLMAMYPKADVPVLQVSLPSLEPKAMLQLGEELAPLRDEGVLLIGSGFITHNLRRIMERTPQWATEFDGWVAEKVALGDVGALLEYPQKGPGVDIALPTHEHFVPLLSAVGAAKGEKASFPITGFWFGGSGTKRSVQLG